jgi:hypothetical protein|tara:strand:- start:1260 stop:2000 length:741 start_codon:yes stop_codon:yes gene_type:complete
MTTKLEKSNLGWAGIIPALLKAQQDVRAVEKSSENNFQHYKYASAEDMYEASRNVLHKHGICVTRKSLHTKASGQTTLETDGSTTTTEAQKMVVVYIVSHKDGHHVECETEYPICVGKGKPSDKALNASMTTCLSYFLRDLLLIPRCDEEVDQRPDTVARSGVRQTNKPKGKGTRTNQKEGFMGAVGQWINRDISTTETAEACIVLLKKNDLPVDGTATPKQFEEIKKIVEEYIADGIDPASILTE